MPDSNPDSHQSVWQVKKAEMPLESCVTGEQKVGHSETGIQEGQGEVGRALAPGDAGWNCLPRAATVSTMVLAAP